MSKESELEELKTLLSDSELYKWGKYCTAQKIINTGYTKFDVGELKRKLKEIQQELANQIDDNIPATGESISAMGAMANCEETLKFIHELEK